MAYFNKGREKKSNKKQYTEKEQCEEIIDLLIIQDSSSLFDVFDEKKRALLIDKINKMYGDSKGSESINIDYILKTIEKMMKGYGPIDELISDKEISDIKIYGYDSIRVKRLGKRGSTDVKFESNEAYLRFVKMIALKNEIPLSDLNAVQKYTDKRTSEDWILRVNITTGLVNSSEIPCVHIRKISKHKVPIGNLIDVGMMSRSTANYLIDAAENATGILFTGKGGSGKTTLMNTLLEYIPHEKSGLVIQENEELFSKKHPDIMFQHIVTANGDGKTEYTLEKLAVNGLLVDLDYYIIGEIKGNEAAQLMIANYTGHQAWTSVHGKSGKEAIYKLADYVKQATKYELDDVLRMLTGFEIIVFMKDYTVDEICELRGYEKGELVIETVFKNTDNFDKLNAM